MAISVTCSCGARLEIDDKFAGKHIPCPDCQRPLNTAAGTPAPPDLPAGGLALTSLIIALVGFFTVVGSLAAVVVGYLAHRRIARAPERIGGLKLARAGMIVGAVGTLLTVGAFVSNDFVSVDSLLREWRYGAQLNYAADSSGFYTSPLGKDERLGLQRPSRSWGRLQARGQSSDTLTLLNLREDAQIVCLPINAGDENEARDKAASRFRDSDLFKFLSKTGEIKVSPDDQPKPVAEGKDGDQQLDIQFAGYERTFLLRVVKVNGEFYLLAGGTRKGRFPRLADEIGRAFDTFKQVEN